jgi:hypothetical protein
MEITKMVQAMFEVEHMNGEVTLVGIRVDDPKSYDGDRQAKRLLSNLVGIENVTFKGIVTRMVWDCRDLDGAISSIEMYQNLSSRRQQA